MPPPTIEYQLTNAIHEWSMRRGPFYTAYTHTGELNGDTFKEIASYAKGELMRRWEERDAT